MAATGTTNGRMISVQRYIRDKINMLKDEFLLNLSSAEIEELKACETHDEVDRHAHKIMRKHWDRE